MRRHKSAQSIRRRTDLAVAVAVLAGLAGFAFLVITMQGLTHDLHTANEARDALARQVQELGGTPVAGKPGSRGDIGPSGIPGRDGADGKDAPTITPSPGASGAPGKPGADSTVPGPTGPAGQPGADSTVPGPTGPVGQPGADSTIPGPQGERGEKGEAGDTGPEGPAGQSCEEGYSWQTPEYDPDARICRRDGAPDPDPPPGNSQPQALDPFRRQYP